MPIYAYRCPDCGDHFELLRPAVQRDEPARCPSCGHEKAPRSMDPYACAVQGSSTSGAGATALCGSGGGFT